MAEAAGAPSGRAAQRLDKWLWFARVVKTRTTAQKLVLAGLVRINREKTLGASRPVHPGDVLTIALDGGVRVLRVLAPGERRGPAPEAQLLYEDLSPPRGPSPRTPEAISSGQRPTKRERRALDAFRHRDPSLGDDFSSRDD